MLPELMDFLRDASPACGCNPCDCFTKHKQYNTMKMSLDVRFCRVFWWDNLSTSVAMAAAEDSRGRFRFAQAYLEAAGSSQLTRLFFFAHRLSPGGPGSVPSLQVLQDLRCDVPVNNRDIHMSALDAFVRSRSRPYSCVNQRFELLDGREISAMEFVRLALRWLASDSSEVRLGEFHDRDYRDRVVSILRHTILPVSGITAAAMFAHHPGLVEAVSAVRRSDWQRSIGHHWVGQQHASEPSRANVLARQLLWMSRFSGRMLSELSACGGDFPRDRLSSCLRETAKTALAVALEIEESCADVNLRLPDRFGRVQDRVPSDGIDRSTSTRDLASTAQKRTQTDRHRAGQHRASQTVGSTVRLASVVVPNARAPEAMSRGLYCVGPMTLGSYLFVGTEEQVRLCGAVAVSYDDMYRILAQHCPPSVPFAPASSAFSVALPAGGDLSPPPGLCDDDWLPDLSASPDSSAAVPALGGDLVSCPRLGVQADQFEELSSEDPSASWCPAVGASGSASSSSCALPPTYEAPAVDSSGVVPYPDDVPPGRFDDDLRSLFPVGASSVWFSDASEEPPPRDEFFCLS